ncbi:MAG: hypothetical protein ACFFBP_19075 [Promethearchaeota archaeon]
MEKIDKTFGYYEKVRESLSGLAEILNINFSENNFYHQVGMDNLKALNENILEIMKSCHTPREIRIKLRELENDEIESNNPFPF